MRTKPQNFAEIRRYLSEVRRARRAEAINRWLVRLGRLVRPFAYVGLIAFLIWWLRPYAVALTRSTANLAPIDFVLIGGCVVGLLGIAIPGALLLFNIHSDRISATPSKLRLPSERDQTE